MKIIKATPENMESFNKEIKTPNLIAFVKIYSDGCGHCKNLEPKWKQLEEELKNDKSEGILASLSSEHLEDADCDTDIMGVPTLRVFQGGKRKMDYEGKRETSDMKLFFKNLLKTKKGGKRRTKKRRRKKKKTSRKKKKTSRKKKKTSRKKKKTRRKKTRKGGDQPKINLVDVKVAARIASALKESDKNNKYADDATRFLQNITSNKQEEEDGLKDLICHEKVGEEDIIGECGSDLNKKVKIARLQLMKNVRKNRSKSISGNKINKNIKTRKNKK
tara:strand:+ start:6290 stop:7114 length:825 start_codon:yes stop_codon:yes gene_type:complete